MKRVHVLIAILIAQSALLIVAAVNISSLTQELETWKTAPLPAVSTLCPDA